jgi:hypothetical protein
VNAFGPLVAFYDSPGRKGEVIYYFSVPYTTQDILILNVIIDDVDVCIPSHLDEAMRSSDMPRHVFVSLAANLVKHVR